MDSHIYGKSSMFVTIFLILILAIVSICTAQECPDGCTCWEHSSSVFCNNLDRYPTALPPGYTVLNLDYCKLPDTIPVLPMEYQQLEELFIHSSGIRDISEGAFGNLPKLSVLSLKGNSLESLRPDMFRGLGMVRDLNLVSNLIKTLQNEVFHELPNLENLDVSQNKGLQLEELALDGHDLLAEVTLSGCNLKEVPSKALAKAQKLERLGLHGNNFSQGLGDGVFSDLKNVKDINLDQCQITSIHEKAFKGVSKLKSIRLSLNSLTGIPERAFASCEQTIRIVHLEKNQFKSLPEGLLPWAELSELRLDHNPWQCDCGIKWMGKIEYDHTVHEANITCASPEQYVGMQAYNTTVSLECYKRSYIGVYVAIPLIIILTAVIIFIIVKICQTRRQDPAKGVRYSAVYKDTVYKGGPLDYKA